MNVTKINSVSFMGIIIDSHAHIGHHDGHYYTKENLDVFVKEPLRNNDVIEKMIVSDLDVLYSYKDEYKGNKEALKILKPDSKYVLVASCSPKNGNIKNIKRLVQEFPDKIAGLKFHPAFQDFETTRAEYEPYMEFAQNNNLPCLFHTDVKLDAEGKLTKELSKADPESVYNLAKKYKTVPVIIAHLGAGWNEAHDKAINILVQSIINGDANLYADISWVDIDADFANDGKHRSKEHIIKAIKTLKGIGNPSWKYGDQSYRILFGTDAPIARFNPKNNSEAREYYTNFIEDIKYAIRQDKDLGKDAEKIIDDLFYNNAEKLYLEPLKKKNIKGHKNTNYIKISIISLILSLFAGIGIYLTKSKSIIKQAKPPQTISLKNL